jgi:putative membrane protein
MEFTSLLLWLHFLGMVVGLGAGIALAVVGPRLISGPIEEREAMWDLEKVFSRVGEIGVASLLVTGPLMVWLRFGGAGSLGIWFWVKMLLVAIAVVGIAGHAWAGRRFYNGDKTAVPLMLISGRVAGGSMALAMLSAVLTFN